MISMDLKTVPMGWNKFLKGLAEYDNTGRLINITFWQTWHLMHLTSAHFQMLTAKCNYFSWVVPLHAKRNMVFVLCHGGSSGHISNWIWNSSGWFWHNIRDKKKAHGTAAFTKHQGLYNIVRTKRWNIQPENIPSEILPTEKSWLA